ncbi:hypothetical protein M408DRAFT_328374 [Serendipita vermifera MAFF 305830]|uniref:Uncharacterized protein n=1 Tax=Serendipita vermifera MAFF 305830 TaxID=933852 RepID=A0A0C3BCP1_SERVB|nr:hypothetical protein M408DRAFT_328372 [Serendipita vermifera MAFF 305830]KIM29905.1 hypothetical protein M408DRAFT_328374 [Serendipita vermifera MAFF 305830]
MRVTTFWTPLRCPFPYADLVAPQQLAVRPVKSSPRYWMSLRYERTIEGPVELIIWDRCRLV